MSRTQRRRDAADDVVVARREQEQDLGQRQPTLGRTLEQQGADLLGPRRAAWLAGHQHVDAGAAQGAGEALDLGRLAGALAAFERDQPPAPRHATKRGMGRRGGDRRS